MCISTSPFPLSCCDGSSKILHISQRERERRDSHSNISNLPRILLRRKIRLFGKNTASRATPNECGFLTFSPVRRLFVSRVERQSFEAFENLFESYRTIRYLALLSQYHGGSKKKKERKKIFDRLVYIFLVAPLFLFSFLLFNWECRTIPNREQSNEAIDSSRKQGGRLGCDQVGTVSHKRNASTLVPIKSFLCNQCSVASIPSPSSIGKPRYPVINALYVFHHRGHPLLLLEKDRKDTPHTEIIT